MAFGKEKISKEEKAERKAAELMEKYGLQEISDPRDVESLRQIASSLMGNKFISLGSAMSGKPYEAGVLTYQQAIVEQNFLIIRLLNRLLEK